MSIATVRFTNFKALQTYSVSLQRMSILVGPNNSGKSTVLSAFRVLEQALRTAKSRRPTRVQTHEGRVTAGHVLPAGTIPISLENVHSDYSDSDSLIDFRYSTGDILHLRFPADGGVTMYWTTRDDLVTTTAGFRRTFPDEVQVIPVLGPIEQEEDIVTDETVRRAAGTPRASRHFRNYWWKNREQFPDFQRLVEETWPGMSIDLPELASTEERRLTMFVNEKRIARELYWAGFGFQIWCQLLTHISRCSDSNMLVIDEPEVYLHPQVQRRLLGILRDATPDILLATHSVELLSEADPSEILLVDKARRSARRLHDIDGVQKAVDSIGSIHNITLAELARNRRLLFVESMEDYNIVKRFARVLGYTDLSAGIGVTAIESRGFDSWPRVQALSQGFRDMVGSRLQIAAVYDRDYRCSGELRELKAKLEQDIVLAHFHERKEIENYLLSPAVLKRAIDRAVREQSRRTGEERSIDCDTEVVLDEITERGKTKCSGQYIAKYASFHRSSGKDQATLASEALQEFEQKWRTIDSRMALVAGKDVLRELREYCQSSFKITLTNRRIIDCFRDDDVPGDLMHLIQRLDSFRTEES